MKSLKANDNQVLPSFDPQIVNAVRNTTCSETGQHIGKGDRAAFFPRSGNHYHSDSGVFKSIVMAEASHDRR